MRITVLIPTYRRTEYLAKALRGLRTQKRLADQILIGTRNDDLLTQDFLHETDLSDLPIQQTFTSVPGVIASMSSAAAQATGDLVCLLDDDSEPLPDWLEKIECHFSKNLKLGLLGGRDLLQDHPDWRPHEPTTHHVGRIEWTGRIVGNHHRGTGGFQYVDTVKGCNAAIRGSLLKQLRFEQNLRGVGAQVHWELALCLGVKNLGYSVAYDSDLQIIHHIAPRHDADQLHRGRFSETGLYDMVWNEQFVIHSYAPPFRRRMHLLWSLAVGSNLAPGFLQYLRLLLRRDPDLNTKLRITLQATRDAYAVAQTHRSS